MLITNLIYFVQEILKKIVKSNNRKFTVLVQREPEGGFAGRCLELHGAISYGKNMRELQANMKDAISLILCA